MYGSEKVKDNTNMKLFIDRIDFGINSPIF